MSGVNKVILVGNLGRDPEIKYLEGGNAVAKFPLATSETYKNKEGQRVDQTEWHNVVFWGKGVAETIEKYLKKGSTVYIEGKLRTRSWEDKEKVKRYTTEIIGDVFTMLGRKNDESNTNEFNRNEVASPMGQDEPTDDLPF